MACCSFLMHSAMHHSTHIHTHTHTQNQTKPKARIVILVLFRIIEMDGMSESIMTD